jgi:putative transposase
MIVFEFKVKGADAQYRAIDEAIRTAQFVRNKCLRYWMDGENLRQYDLNKYCRVLAEEYPFVRELNSMARQSSAERAWSAIARFFDNCKKQLSGKKGYPKFKKHSRSVEYKTSGWKLLSPKRIQFTDKKGIGTLKLVGTYDLGFYSENQIKRVRLVRRADGYYCQFCIAVDVKVESEPTYQTVGLDLGIKYFLADSNGEVVENPKFYRQAERGLNRANRQKSKKYRRGAKPQSRNYHKARERYARKHLRVSRQRNEFVKRVAYCVIQSNDLVAYEDLNVKGLVRNRSLAKSISDVGWSTFRRWVEYFGKKYGKVTVAVPPHHTSQQCSNCGEIVKKSLSTRTHVCPHCGYIADRDVNAAINILRKGLSTVGHTGTHAGGDLPSGLVGAIGSASLTDLLLGDGESMNQESPSF